MAITPAEIAARIAASTAKRPPAQRINNTTLLAASGLRVVHFLPQRLNTATGRGEGLTVAYRPVVKRPTVIEISTTVCRKGDTFSRKMGTRGAVENFQAGRTVFVPTMGDVGPVQSLRDMFSNGY